MTCCKAAGCDAWPAQSDTEEVASLTGAAGTCGSGIIGAIGKCPGQPHTRAARLVNP